MRVVIAEDSVLLREGLAKILEDGGFEVVGQAGNADELLLKVRSYEPDVAVVDVRMPPTHTDEGAQAAETIRAQYPDVGVLLLSQIVEARRALQLFSERPEGFGYLLKDRVLEIDDFLEAVRRVARGGTAIDPDVIAQLVGRRRPDDPLAGPDRARAGSAGADGRGPLQSGHRRETLPQPEDDRDAHPPHLPEARSRGYERRSSARARCPGVPRAQLAQ